MLNAISSATQALPVAQLAPTRAPKSATATPEFGGGTDTVQLSQAAQTRLAALQETRETPAQTAREANQGDLQARMLLARAKSRG